MWRYPPSPWRLSAAAAVAAPSLLSEIKGDNPKTYVSNVKILNQSMNFYHNFFRCTLHCTISLYVIISLTRVWQFSTLSWRSVVLSSRRYSIFSSMLDISWKKTSKWHTCPLPGTNFKMTHFLLKQCLKS